MNMTKNFDTWMNKVSAIIQKESGGLTPETISDRNYREDFENNLSEQEAAEWVLTECGFIF